MDYTTYTDAVNQLRQPVNTITTAPVISCSRRTDIPRCYSGWLEEKLVAGGVIFKAPRGGVRSVSLEAEAVHSLVLWSKDYGPLLKRPQLLRRLHDLNPFFHFTITGLGKSAWEPDLPAWRESVAQMKRLVKEFGAARVNWRFDPVLFWPAAGGRRTNLTLFARLGAAVADLGVSGSTFSFAQWYRKSSRRAQREGIDYIDPEPAEKLEAAAVMAAGAARLRIRLASCSNDVLLAVPGIYKGCCIDGALLNGLRGDGLAASMARDESQRRDCGCTRSIDIGSYTQRCSGPACVYCYAS